MMKVEADFICEHGMPQPWVTCHECMFLPFDLRPVPPKPKPEPEPEKPKRAPKRKPSSTVSSSGRVSTNKPKRKAPAKKTSGSKAAPPRKALPKSIDDKSPELTGDQDLAYEIPDSNVRYHVQGSDRRWLPISTMPTELRNRGWVYLKTDDYVVARCRVTSIGYREHRWSHEHPDRTSDVGAGPTLELDGDWEFMTVDVGPEGAVEIRGYRYLTTGDDGVVRPALPADV